VSCFRLIDEERARYDVSLLARVLGVTRAGYYSWKRRPPCARAVADVELGEQVRRVHAESEGIYGAPRIHAVDPVSGLAIAV
jgi:putative transposase